MCEREDFYYEGAALVYRGSKFISQSGRRVMRDGERGALPSPLVSVLPHGNIFIIFMIFMIFMILQSGFRSPKRISSPSVFGEWTTTTVRITARETRGVPGTNRTFCGSNPRFFPELCRICYLLDLEIGEKTLSSLFLEQSELPTKDSFHSFIRVECGVESLLFDSESVQG